MNSPELSIVKKDALALTELERAALARDLLSSLDTPNDPDASEAWDIEICRRINEIECGKAQLIDSDEVLTKVKKRLNNN